jgi:hypothetical protein
LEATYQRGARRRLIRYWLFATNDVARWMIAFPLQIPSPVWGSDKFYSSSPRACTHRGHMGHPCLYRAHPRYLSQRRQIDVWE